jgi:AraC-like DNA-binding protein
VRYDQPANELDFDAAVLDWPLTTADPAALQLAREQCERALEALGFDGGIVARVRPLISRSGGGFRSLDEVAARLHVSPRTLKRRLAERATTFSTLLDQARLERAQRLLASPRLSLEEIAERAGYSDVTNFTRAFRRWTGTTPAAYRRSLPADRS